MTLKGQRFQEEKLAYIKIFHTALLWKYDFYEHLLLLQGEWEVLQGDNSKVTEGNHSRQMRTHSSVKGNVVIQYLCPMCTVCTCRLNGNHFLSV